MNLNEALFIARIAPPVAGLYCKDTKRLICADVGTPRILLECDTRESFHPIGENEKGLAFDPREAPFFSIKDAMSDEWGIVIRKEDVHPISTYQNIHYSTKVWNEDEVLERIGEYVLYDREEAIAAVLIEFSVYIEKAEKAEKGGIK